MPVLIEYLIQVKKCGEKCDLMLVNYLPCCLWHWILSEDQTYFSFNSIIRFKNDIKMSTETELIKQLLAFLSIYSWLNKTWASICWPQPSASVRSTTRYVVNNTRQSYLPNHLLCIQPNISDGETKKEKERPNIVQWSAHNLSAQCVSN
jgi:hypothetical protein